MKGRISLTLVLIFIFSFITLHNVPSSNFAVSADSHLVVFDSEPAANNSYEIGSPITLSWRASNEVRNGDFNYTIFDNGTTQHTEINYKFKNFEFPLDYITIAGLHIITIEINYTDSEDLMYSDTFEYWVEVYPAEAPNLTFQPSGNVTYQEGSIGHHFNWTVFDASSITYSIWINGSIDHNGNPWQSGQRLTYNIDGLTLGEEDQITSYNITILFTDSLGYETVDTVYVFVTENFPPQLISIPDDISYQYGTTGHILDWTISDDDPSYYTITVDDIELNETISNPFVIGTGNSISYSIDGLAIGTYRYTLEIFDTYGNSVSDTVDVIVEDSEGPTIMSAPDDMTYTYGQVGNQFSYELEDQFPSTYKLYRNGTLSVSGNWFSAQPFTINIDGYNVGTYNITIVFYDEYDNFVHDTTFLTVLPISTIRPDLVITDSITSGSIESISGTWGCQEQNCNFDGAMVTAVLFDADNSQVHQESYSLEGDGSYQLLLDYTRVPPGLYQWQITFEQLGLQSQNLEYDVTVLKQQISLDVIMPSHLDRGQELTIDVLASISIASNYLGLDTLTGPEGNLEGIEVRLILNYIDPNGDDQTWSATQFTNSTGYATFLLNGDLTGQIRTISGIEATGSSLYGTVSSYTVSSSDFPTINGPLNSGNDTSGDMGSPFNNYLYLAIGVVITFLVLVGGFYFTNDTKLDEIDYFQQLQSLRSVILYNKNGIPIFDVNLGNFATSTTLVAGLSSAITNFLDELSETEKGEIYIMEKSDLYVLSHKLEESALAVVSTIPYSDVFKANFVKAHKQMAVDLPHQIFELSFSQSDKVVIDKTLDILSDNDLHLRIQYPSMVEFDLLRERRNNGLPKVIRNNYEILMHLEDIVDRPKGVEYWLDAMSEFGISRTDAIKIIINLDKEKLLTVSSYLLTS